MGTKLAAARKRFNREVFDFFVADALRSQQLRKLTKKVLAAQAILRRATDEKAWLAYLDLEKAVNRRAESQMRRLFRRLLLVRRDE